MALTPEDVDELHVSMKSLLELWMKIKLVFAKAFAAGPVSREHEAAYLQLKSEISRVYRTAATKLPSGLLFDGDKMVEMLKNAMTIEHLQNQNAADKQVMYNTWHRVYVKMTRTFGALEVMKQGYYPNVHRARLKSPAPQAAKAVKK